MFYDRAKSIAVTCNTTGNATFTAADAGHALPPTAINETVIYTLLDSGGSNWETGRATLSESTGTYTLTRGGSQVVTDSSSGGSAVSFTNSSQHTLFLSADAQFYRNAEVHIETQTASASASIDFDLPAGFSEYKIVVRELVAANDGVNLFLSASTDAGSTYLNTSGDYYHAYVAITSSGTAADNGSETSTVGVIVSGDIGNASTKRSQAIISLGDMSSTSRHKTLMCHAVGVNSGGDLVSIRGGGGFMTTSAVDNVKLSLTTGNISSGTFKLYGIVD